jgi:exoribonuclease R
MKQYNIEVDEDNFNPLKFKLFSEDVFNYDFATKEFSLNHSVIRSTGGIAGILIMNKTYGRTANDKLYYKCIPDDKRLPEFLIPVGSKPQKTKLVKTKQNSFIIFSFISWDDKHPIGQLKQTIGDVGNMGNFFEYQLYCKNLNISMHEFIRATSNAMKRQNDQFYITGIMEKYKNIENRLYEEIISIDPPNSQDFDDAFSITMGDEPKTYKISIYISNVALVLDYFNLWTSFSERISTIYLPDRKRPMIPTILSDNLCSLREQESRVAFCIDIFFKDYEIVNMEYKNAIIKVAKNYTYEEPALLKNAMYIKLLEQTIKISRKYKYTSVKNSHDLVSYYMIFMNYEMSKLMVRHKNGIYRSVVEGSSSSLDIPDNLPDDISNFVKIFHSLSGKYSSYENITPHTYISSGLDSYLHITSPIRRLVDLLNLIKFEDNIGEIKMSADANVFYDKWFDRLDYINTTMRNIKKVQTNCSLLYMCVHDETIMNKVHDGYIFDKLERNDMLYHYNVYLPELKMVSKIVMKDNLQNYSNKQFKLYIFGDEHNIKKKIRLQIVDI